MRGVKLSVQTEEEWILAKRAISVFTGKTTST